jgi:deoxyribodipyrimidine photolyase
VIRPVRSFNPEIQQNKFDKDGGVYRKWIKDLIWDGDPMVNMLYERQKYCYFIKQVLK